MSQTLRNELYDLLKKEYPEEDTDFINGIMALAKTDELTQNIINVIEDWKPESVQVTMFALDQFQKKFPDEY